MSDTIIELSSDQIAVLEKMCAFAEIPSARKFITVGGYAGVGKTFLLGELQRTLGTDFSIAFVAYTGKAASVLARKLDEFDYCGTIHSLIYRPVEDEKGRIIGWQKREDRMSLPGYDLIVIDEASMVGEEIFKDLLEYEIPIIAVGDHGQLPPVKSSFNLMKNPMYKLEKIHRQAEGNPIIKLSIMARKDGAIPYGEFGEGVRKVKGLENLNDLELDEWMVLCGTNRMRQEINRMALDGRVMPIQGDKVICLKNNARKGIYNGMVGFIKGVELDGKHWLDLEVEFDDAVVYRGRVLKRQFGEAKTLHDWRGSHGEQPGDLFDWAYCLTVHKAQGSESEKVVLIEETLGFLKPDDWKRWLYTGVTRSKRELLVIKP